MKIIPIGKPQVIMSNPESHHNYFGWPTVEKLKNGRIAVVASGFRLRHICPFGKTVISYSEDGGRSYTLPAPVIDTPLDDRDGGILAFGDGGVIVTSFNNTTDMQRNAYTSYNDTKSFSQKTSSASPYTLAYLDTVSSEEEDDAIGANFRISLDNGITFGRRYKSPVTSPHGPLELPDGTLLWVGRTFSAGNKHRVELDCIQAHRIFLDGHTEYVGEIENIDDGGAPLLSCEPHAILLDDGRIIAHIRVHRSGEDRVFTVYQSESCDMGKTWTKPHALLSKLGGSPPHLIRHSSGALICTYACREAPYTVKAMFSLDGGRSWETDVDLCVNGVCKDMGYPSTVELEGGELLTVFYAHESIDGPAVIMQQRWKIDK